MNKFLLEFSFDNAEEQTIVYNLNTPEEKEVLSSFLEIDPESWSKLSPDQKDKVVDEVIWKYLDDFQEQGLSWSSYLWQES